MTRYSDPLADPYLPNPESEEHVRREQQRLEEDDNGRWEEFARALERTFGEEGNRE